ncbi:hypothetical protein JCM39068_26400 [Desulfocastanea catecholica]
MFRVREGDLFTYKVYVKLRGDIISAQAGVAVFDEKMSVVSWDYAKESTVISNEWVLLEKVFSIPSKISYIQVRLSGTGKGEFRFDDIYFKNVINTRQST